MPRKYKKRLTIEIDDMTHGNIKKTCVDQKITIRIWVMEAIAEKIRRDGELGFK